MKKAMAILLAILIFASGFYIGNRYYLKGEASGQLTGDGSDETDGTEDSSGETEDTSEDQSFAAVQAETASVGLGLTESSQTGSAGQGALLSDFEITLQMPELPTGCEITAMTMVLNYYGYRVSKMEMALEYLPTVEPEFYRDDTGRMIGPDLENYFVGDPTTETGYICGTGAIVTAANAYLRSAGSELTATAYSDADPEMLYRLLDEGTPVVIWCTINMEDRAETDGWYREDGTYMEWSSNDHGAVLIGYDEDTVTVADPIYSTITCDREQFEKIFAQRGGKCVVLG